MNKTKEEIDKCKYCDNELFKCDETCIGCGKNNTKKIDMSKEEIANKEMEALSWLTKQGYDRKASQQIAPILVKYSSHLTDQIKSMEAENKRLNTKLDEDNT